MPLYDDLSTLLKQEMILAMGCTEPAACALAGARASELLGCKPEKVSVKTTRDILKNAMGVSIPGFHKKGVGAAVALGVAGHDTALGLDILSLITEEQKKVADSLDVAIDLVDVGTSLYILVELEGEGHHTAAAIGGEHTHFCHLEKDGKVLLDEDVDDNGTARKIDNSFMETLTMHDILDYSAHMPSDIQKLLLDAIDTNMRISKESLKAQYGLGVGRSLMKGYHYPPRSYPEALDVGAALAAGGSDARMAGCQMPVVINSGSGNQGITLTVPIAVVSEYLGKSDRDTAQALCIAELTGLVLTALKGRLSAQCGAFTAATGMGCGLAWLNGGDEDVLERVIKNMVGNLVGVICDGAKMTCALKIHSCVESAYLASKLALEGQAPTPECGIVGEDAKATLGNLSKLTHAGMEPTDHTILSIMLGKNTN
jgi:L-cysteine desulfidase